MPWTYVGVSPAASSASGNITLTEPSGVQQGDLLVAIISYRSNAGFTSPGSPWVSVTSQNTGNTTANATTSISSGHMFYCIRGASAPGLTFTRTAGDIALARIVAYRGVDGTNPLVTQTSTTMAAAATAVSVTGLTTANAEDLIVVGFCAARNTSVSAFNATNPGTSSGTAANETANPLAGEWHERADSATTTGADAGLGIGDAVRATAGVTGNLTMTAGASARHVVVAGAFKMFIPPPRTGTLAATETGSDTASIAGDVIVKGPLAATETGSDTAAMAGVLTNGRTGSLAATETGADTAAIAGDVLIRGALAATDGADTAAIQGDVLVRGALAAIETGSDTASLAGDVLIRGALAVSEAGADVAALAGVIPIRGTFGAIETGLDVFLATSPGAVVTGRKQFGVTGPVKVGRMMTF